MSKGLFINYSPQREQRWISVVLSWVCKTRFIVRSWESQRKNWPKVSLLFTSNTFNSFSPAQSALHHQTTPPKITIHQYLKSYHQIYSPQHIYVPSIDYSTVHNPASKINQCHKCFLSLMSFEGIKLLYIELEQCLTLLAPLSPTKFYSRFTLNKTVLVSAWYSG